MARAKKPITLTLTSLMDVFTNLVFFLLLSQGVANVDEPPKNIKLPDSFVDTKARPALNILVSDQEILVDGQPAAANADVLAANSDLIPGITDKLKEIKAATMGINDQSKEGSHEVVILADGAVPFKVMKRIMASCTSVGYGKISLAVRENSGVTAPPRRM